MSVNLKQVYNAIHDLGREIVMLESPDDGIGIAFERMKIMDVISSFCSI